MAPPPSEPPLPDDLLEDIFLRLDGGADLARAAAACTAFRRIACARRFLRRFLSLHPPPVLGFLNIGDYGGGFLPAGPPHPSAPAARAVVQAADFTYSFLPEPTGWLVQDALRGRVLLSRRKPTTIFEDIVVCDPLHRRYVEIPPIPEHLVASMNSSEMKFEPFLAPAEQEEVDELSFRVVCNVMSQYNIVAFIFSSVTGQWRSATSFSLLPDRLIRDPRMLVRHHVRNCFYWAHTFANQMLVLDLGEMKFSVVGLPPRGAPWRWLAIVDAGEAMLGLLVADDHTLHRYCKPWRNNGVTTEEWFHDKRIPLHEFVGCYWHIVEAAEGYLLMRAEPRGLIHQSGQTRQGKFFTMTLKTLVIERLCVLDQTIRRAQPYASFPPPLSLPTI
ncbi:hypothetical protein ACP70R_018584 [Stipagrostis hirtigluma subsp. patula]